jgi:hypothetical protein
MQRVERDFEFGVLETMLKSLTPSDAPLDRDRMLYAAGQRAAEDRERRRQQMWQASTVAVALIAIGLTGLLLAAPGRRHEVDRAPEANIVQSSNDAATKVNGASPGPQEVAFSGIHDVEAWSPKELAKQGISIRPWQHPLQSEVPRLDWVRVTLDHARLPGHTDLAGVKEIVMTAWFVDENGVSQSAARTNDEKRKEGVSSLLFMAKKPLRAKSRVEILIWTERPGGGSRAYGYRLSLKRVVDLANLAVAGTS